eukprot:g4440.t1
MKAEALVETLQVLPAVVTLQFLPVIETLQALPAVVTLGHPKMIVPLDILLLMLQLLLFLPLPLLPSTTIEDRSPGKAAAARIRPTSVEPRSVLMKITRSPSAAPVKTLHFGLQMKSADQHDDEDHQIAVRRAPLFICSPKCSVFTGAADGDLVIFISTLLGSTLVGRILAAAAFPGDLSSMVVLLPSHRVPGGGFSMVHGRVVPEGERGEHEGLHSRRGGLDGWRHQRQGQAKKCPQLQQRAARCGRHQQRPEKEPRAEVTTAEAVAAGTEEAVASEEGCPGARSSLDVPGSPPPAEPEESRSPAETEESRPPAEPEESRPEPPPSSADSSRSKSNRSSSSPMAGCRCSASPVERAIRMGAVSMAGGKDGVGMEKAGRKGMGKEALGAGVAQRRGLQERNRCLDRQDDLSCVPGGDTIELEDCGLTDDDLVDLAECFDNRGRDSITSLNLNFNGFTYIPDGLFKGFDNLEQLSLAENELTGLPALVFDGLNALQTLQLYRNAFTTLPAGLFDDLGKLTRLTLGDNEDLLCLPDLTGSSLLTAEQLELPSSDFDPTALCACPLAGEEGFCDDCEPGVDGFVCSGQTCDNGLIGVSQGDICCEASCGTCGGVGCSGRGNGQDSCCTKNIAANGETCSVKGAAPCIMDGDVAPTPAPVMEPTTGFSCSGDAGILKGDVCCEESCCTKNIAANGETCSVKGAAPCILDDDIASTGYDEVGCYGDKIDPDRIMGDVTSSSSMTIEVCQAHCAGSAYFGVQYAIECWCSGSDSADYPYDVHGASTDCTKPCSGNAAEICGGDWAMNVYKNV